MSASNGDDLRQDFTAAIKAAKKDPANEQVWDTVESLAGSLDSPDEAARAYMDVLNADLAPEVANVIGERAARFQQEWYGQDSAGLVDVLRRVLEVDPAAEWAFQRLTMVLTVAERWDDLFGLYDSTIKGAKVKKRKIKLLDEAVQVAKEVANLPDQAIYFLQELIALKPGDAQLAQSLERLLEREGRWKELIDLWESRLDELPLKERLATRGRIAQCWLENLDDPGPAMEAARRLMATAVAETDLDEETRAAAETEVIGILERLVTSEKTSPDVRDNALSMLRTRLESAGRLRDLVRVLEGILELSDESKRRELRQESAEILAELKEDQGALAHYAALLTMEPASTLYQEQMRDLARRSGNFAAYADGLSAAAEACSDAVRRVALLSDAAHTRLEHLSDEAGAVDLLQSAMALEGLMPDTLLSVGRQLERLYARLGRSAERLEVLDQMTRIEPDTDRRAELVGEASRLAEELGDVERALAGWRQRLEINGQDIKALDAMVDLLDRSRNWEPLIEALGLRAGAPVPRTQKRSDLMRIAQVYQAELNDAARAIAAWKRVQEETGETPESVDALAALYEETEQWPELGDLLERASARESGLVARRLTQLGDIYQRNLGAPDRALTRYRSALEVEPTNAGARAGLYALAELEQTRVQAVEALARCYRENREWTAMLELVEPRLNAAEDPVARLTILREAAQIHQEHTGNAEAALELYARALPLDPRNRILEDLMLKLAQKTGRWETAVAGLGAAAEAVSEDQETLSHLRFRQAVILESRLDNNAEAYGAYLTVAGIEPDNRPSAEAVVRIGSRMGRWDEVCATLVAHTRARARLDDPMVVDMEAVAAETDGFQPMATALEAALEQTGDLPRTPAFNLWWRIGRWRRDRLQDPAAAEAALLKAVALDDRRIEILRELAQLQRSAPGRPLYDTLTRIVDLEPGDMDVLYEAARLALEHLNDPQAAATSLGALMGRASAAWKGTAEAKGTEPPEKLTAWAIEKLVELYTATGRPAASVDLLMDASRLPFDPETQRSMRTRAATVAAEALGDTSTAVEVYRGILAQAPDDAEATRKLGEIYEKEERIAELLTLRKLELDRGPAPERKLELRLEIARLVGEVEKRGGRLEVLKANLAESPGHPESIEALYAVLDSMARHGELADLLADQAKQLQSLEENERAAGLWLRVADLATRHTDEPERALEAFRNAATLAPQRQTLEAVARLFIERGEPAQAVPWLRKAVAASAPPERSDMVLLLARAHIDAGKPDKAVAALQDALAQDGAQLEVRSLLADLYRESEAWEPLASLLADTAPHLDDEKAAAACAREAAEIYHDRLKAPDLAVPALQKALSVEPTDRTLRTKLAVSLRAAERFDEAREILDALVKDFGRRRSAERAAVHVELAKLARARGDLDEALKQLDQASHMDVGNPNILRMVAELSDEKGDLEQAERSYRALLLVLRRQPPGDDEEAIGPSEVLYELHRIAKQHGDESQSAELMESTLEAAAASDAEVRRLRRTVLPHGETALLLNAFQARLKLTDTDEARVRLLTDIAQIQDMHMNRGPEALGSCLEALKLASGDKSLQDYARSLAQRCGQVDRYVEVLSGIVEGLRRTEDATLLSRLLMRLGDVAEYDLGDGRKAADFYAQAEETGENQVEAQFALARVAGAIGDEELQARVLEQLRRFATSGERLPVQADVLYLLAKFEVGSEEHRAHGLELVEQALGIEPRFDEAGDIVRAAADAEPENIDILALYERVAAESGDWRMQLDFLERRAGLPGAPADHVKEAVDLALAHEQSERAEALLVRAVQAARDSAEGVRSAVWAAVGLAERRRDAGDLGTARDLFYEIADVADQEQVTALGLSLAARAAEGQDADLDLACEVYEFLRQRNPTSREIWAPLYETYYRSGNADGLRTLVNDTVPGLAEVADRNFLRMKYAQYLIEDLDEGEQAAEILREVIYDDPDHLQATALFEQVLRKAGNLEPLADFLWQRFADAKERGNPETVGDLGFRLGSLLAEMGSDQVLTVYRDALEVAPHNRDLLLAVLERIDPEADRDERAQLMEQLLAVEKGEAAAALAKELCAIREMMADGDGLLRALELGYRACPADETLKVNLETTYRQAERWDKLAEMMVIDAEAQEDYAVAIGRFREAAALYRDTLADLGGAAEALKKAYVLAPDNEQLASELARTLAAAGDVRGAVDVLTETLEREVEGHARVDLLLTRSELRLALGEEGPAVDDIEEAFKLDELVRPQLLAALEQRRATAQQAQAPDVERPAMMRLVELMVEGGQADSARALLSGWVEREPRDVEALYALRDIATSTQHWESVMEACVRLVVAEKDDAQVDAAVRLTEAARAVERPSAARKTLEFVHKAQPENTVIRDQLRQVYEEAEAWQELAQMLLADAKHAADEDAKYECLRRAADILANRLDDAAAAMEPAVAAAEIRPDDHDTIVMLADVLTKAGRFQDAMDMLDPAIAKHKRRSPKLAELLVRRARLAAVMDDSEGHLELMKKAFDTDRKNALIAAEFAKVATDRREWDLALRALRAISLMEEDGPVSRVQAILWEARIEYARGNKAKAELWAKKALREDPDYKEAQDFLDEIGG